MLLRGPERDLEHGDVNQWSAGPVEISRVSICVTELPSDTTPVASFVVNSRGPINVVLLYEAHVRLRNSRIAALLGW